jgi:hypothetical protein
MTTNQLNEIPTMVKKFIDEQKKTVNAQLKTVTKRVETETKTLEKWLNDADWLKTAQKWQKDLQTRAENLRVDAFHLAGLATTTDVEQLQRKLNTINKKITN